MKKYLLLSFLVFSSLLSSSQYILWKVDKSGGNITDSFYYKTGVTDSVYKKSGNTYIAKKKGKTMYYPVWDMITGKPAIISGTELTDTAAAIRAAIPSVASKLNISDTASMLTPYLRSVTAAVNYASSSHTHTFSAITSQPTTLAGYGITDAAASSHTHAGVYQPADADLTTYAGITPSTNVQSLLGAANYAAIRTQLSLVPGTDVLAPNGNGSSLTGITQSQITNLTSDMAAKAPLLSPSFTTPVIGVATGASLAVTGAITSSGTAGIGYATGAGGTVTQATSKSTGVTLNKITGEITLNGAALAAGTIVSFTLTNSTVASTDVMILNHVTTGTRGGYTLNAQCAAGSAVIYVRNNTAGSLSEAIVIRFAVVKGVTN